MKSAKNETYHFSWIESLKMGLLHLLDFSVMNTFWEIKENVTMKKTDMEFHCFDQTIGPCYFWQIDLMCNMPVLYCNVQLHWWFKNDKLHKALTNTYLLYSADLKILMAFLLFLGWLQAVCFINVDFFVRFVYPSASFVESCSSISHTCCSLRSLSFITCWILFALICCILFLYFRT